MSTQRTETAIGPTVLLQGGGSFTLAGTGNDQVVVMLHEASDQGRHATEIVTRDDLRAIRDCIDDVLKERTSS